MKGRELTENKVLPSIILAHCRIMNGRVTRHHAWTDDSQGRGGEGNNRKDIG
jgi:hypothetical protein